MSTTDRPINEALIRAAMADMKSKIGNVPADVWMRHLPGYGGARQIWTTDEVLLAIYTAIREGAQ